MVVIMFWVLAVSAPTQSWSLRVRGTVLEVFYGTGGSAPQYAALHLDSSYFRLNYGPGSSWGTSVISDARFLVEWDLLSRCTCELEPSVGRF
jgi:hypothetical protein